MSFYVLINDSTTSFFSNNTNNDTKNNDNRLICDILRTFPNEFHCVELNCSCLASKCPEVYFLWFNWVIISSGTYMAPHRREAIDWTNNDTYAMITLNHIVYNIFIGSRGPFYKGGLTLVPACISNYFHYKVWYDNTYLFPNFLEMGISFYHTLYDRYNYSFILGLNLMHVSKMDPRRSVGMDSGPFTGIPALVQTMACRLAGAKPFSEPMPVS